MQVMQLEKLVKLLEDQQDRAQAQRTRLEHRIAQLEVSLRDKTKNSNRYVISECNSRKSDRSYVVDDRVSRALPRESERALLEESTPTFRLINPHPRKRLEFPRYLYRGVSPSKSLNPPPSSIAASYRSKSARFHVDDWCCTCSDKEEAFICERCRREAGEKFKGDTVYQIERDRHDLTRKSLYGWLMGSSTLESGTTDDNADCFFRIVSPGVARDDVWDRSRESRDRRRQYCSRSSRRFLYGTFPRRCGPIIRT